MQLHFPFAWKKLESTSVKRKNLDEEQFFRSYAHSSQDVVKNLPLKRKIHFHGNVP